MDSAKMVKLADISELITKGTTPTTLGYSFQEEGVKFLKIECFDEEGVFISEKVAYISEECNEKLKRSQIKENDILFSIAGAIGRVAVATPKMLPANTNQALAIIRIKKGVVYIPYLKLILISKIVKDQFEKQKQGVAQLNLSLKNIGDLEVPIYTIEKQKEFVELFNKVQGVINSRKQQLEQLDLLIKARFVEMFGDTVINSMGWEERQLDEYIEFITSGSRGWAQYFVDEGNELFITIKNVKNNHITLDDIQYVDPPVNKEAERTKVKAGDLLISITADLGRTGVVDKRIAEKGAYINQHLSLVRICSEKVEPLYVSYYLETDRGKRQFQSKNQNGVKAGLNFEAIKSLKILVPPIEKQIEYLNFVAQVDKSKFDNEIA